jgi:hypothetical protein
MRTVSIGSGDLRRRRRDLDRMNEKTVWAIKVLIEATREEADEALEAIARALCPDEDHPGYCPVPWTTVLCAFDDLDPNERAQWTESFADDRNRARQAGEPGA